MQSANILVCELHHNAAVCCKVADLGLSCFYNDRAANRVVDNPCWLGPEVLKRNEYERDEREEKN